MMVRNSDAAGRLRRNGGIFMNQIICDICGSEYPENAECCPSCGFPRLGTESLSESHEDAVRSRVKGGRFSNRNVRRRAKAQRRAMREGKASSDKPLLVVIALLLIAIVLVSAYIVLRFWDGRSALSGLFQQEPAITTTAPTVPSTAAPTVPCTRLVLEQTVVELGQAGEEIQLAVKPMPEGTTDIPTFASSDESVATVSQTGLVTAVGPGQAQITVACGAVSESILVDCWLPEATTLPPETTVPETTAPAPTQPEPQPTQPAVLALDPSDASCFTVNETFTLYVRLGDSTVSRSKVKWTSSDPKIAKVDNGVVTAVSKGTATITAEYQGQKAECVVRCRFESSTASGGQGEQKDKSWRISHSDVTLAIGESFQLTIKNRSGETANVVWTVSGYGVVTMKGNTVTGRDAGTVTLTATVDGTTLSCIVRVK